MQRPIPLSAALLRLALLGAAAFALWASFCKASYVGVEGDAVFYMDPARSCAKGLGLLTHNLETAQLAFYPKGVRLPTLYLHHGPLAPWLIGHVYRWCGLAEWTYPVTGFFFVFLTGLLVYGLAHELSGERTALLAAALYWSSYIILDGAYTSVTDPPFIFFLTAAVSCLWRADRSAHPWPWAGACGLALGLASCTRLAGQTYWPGLFAAGWWLMRKNPKPLAAMAAGLAVCLAGLAAYNHAAAGLWFYSPGYYMLNWSHTFPGFRSRTTFMNLSSLQAVTHYPKDFALKVLTGPLYAVKKTTEAADCAPFMACAILGLLTRFERTGLARFRALTLFLAVPVVLFNAVVSYGSVHYLSPLLPLLAILAAAFLESFATAHLGTLLRVPSLGIAVFLLFFAGPLTVDIKDLWKRLPANQRDHAVREQLGGFVRAHTRPDEVVISDVHRLVAWLAERPTLPLPATPQDARLSFERLPPDALLITSLRSDSEDYDPSWRQALERREPVMGFVPCLEFSVPEALAILYRRPALCPQALPPAKMTLPPAGHD